MTHQNLLLVIGIFFSLQVLILAWVKLAFAEHFTGKNVFLFFLVSKRVKQETILLYLNHELLSSFH